MILVILVLPFSSFYSFLRQWVGHRLLSEKVIRPHVRANRSILIPFLPVSEVIEIWYVPLPSCLGVLVGFCLASLVLICPGWGILDGISVLMV